MSDAPADNLVIDRSRGLSEERIQQLLAAVGSEPAEDTTQIEAAEYDWHQPHCFSSDQLGLLDDFTKRVAAAMADKFGTLCRSDFNVTITSTTQHFAGGFLEQASASEQNDYYLAFGTGHPCGLVSISAQTAVIWATQLLGDSESEKDSSRDLSQLEESLLLDIASAVVDAIRTSHSSYDFQPVESIVKSRIPLELQGTEELCEITFGVEKAGSENPDKIGEVRLLILCDKLEPVVGRTGQADNKLSAEDISEAILEHLREMPVNVTARLASTALTFKQIMSLGVDDILLLDRKIDEPVELIVEEKELFRGRPAKSAGNYAVVITEISS